MHYLTTNVKEKFHHFHEKGDYFFDNCCWFPFLLTDDVAHPSKWMVPRDDRLCVFLCHQTTTWNKMKSSVLREPRFLNNTLSARTTLWCKVTQQKPQTNQNGKRVDSLQDARKVFKGKWPSPKLFVIQAMTINKCLHFWWTSQQSNEFENVEIIFRKTYPLFLAWWPRKTKSCHLLEPSTLNTQRFHQPWQFVVQKNEE